MTDEIYDRIYHEGEAAFNRGCDIADNPYTNCAVFHNQWEAGWFGLQTDLYDNEHDQGELVRSLLGFST